MPTFDHAHELSYGENPHQRAVFYQAPGEGGRSLARARQLQGKELSFNNLVDGPTSGKAGDAGKAKAVALAAKRGFRSRP